MNVVKKMTFNTVIRWRRAFLNPAAITAFVLGLLFSPQFCLAQDGASNLVEVVFLNQHDETAQLYWQSPDGQEQHYGDIQPGQELTQSSRVGDRWVLRDGQIKLGDFVATAAPFSKIPVYQGMGTKARRSNRRWQSAQSNREFVEQNDGSWLERSASGNVLYQFVRNEQGGAIVLRSQSNGYISFNASGLYVPTPEGNSWQYQEKGKFLSVPAKPSSGQTRVWRSDANPANKWRGSFAFNSGEGWTQLDEQGQVQAQLKQTREDVHGIVLTDIADPSSHVLLSETSASYSRGNSWLGLANGGWVVTANSNMGPQKFEPEKVDLRDNPSLASTGSNATPADAAAALKIHNDARQRVRVKPLAWSPKIAASAQAYADELARNDPGQGLEHDPKLGSNGYGENISMVGGQPGNAVSGSRDWLSERAIYEDPNRRGETGHYTEMVWHSTTQVGVGYAVSRSGNTYIVARYFPGGNTENESPYPGAPPISSND